MAPGKQKTISTRQLEAAHVKCAQIVAKARKTAPGQAEKYLLIFKRLDDELAARRHEQSLIDRALEVSRHQY